MTKGTSENRLSVSWSWYCIWAHGFHMFSQRQFIFSGTYELIRAYTSCMYFLKLQPCEFWGFGQPVLRGWCSGRSTCRQEGHQANRQGHWCPGAKCRGICWDVRFSLAQSYNIWYYLAREFAFSFWLPLRSNIQVEAISCYFDMIDIISNIKSSYIIPDILTSLAPSWGLSICHQHAMPWPMAHGPWMAHGRCFSPWPRMKARRPSIPATWARPRRWWTNASETTTSSSSRAAPPARCTDVHPARRWINIDIT